MQLNLHTLPNPKDYVYGGETRIDRVVYQENRDWTPFLPAYEPQSTSGFDSYACVAYSLNNCLETLEKRLYGSQFNRSDRFLAVGSGTVPYVGNSLAAVAEFSRKSGAVEESVYPFVKTQSEYFQRIPDNLFAVATRYKLEYEHQYEWVYFSGIGGYVDLQKELWEVLSYAPLQVTGRFDNVVNGVYNSYQGQANHVVMLFKGVQGQYWEIYDHYDKTIKRLAWDFNFGAVMRHHVIKKNYVPLQDLEGKVIKGDTTSEVYLIENGTKRHFTDEISVWSAGRSLSSVTTVPQQTVQAIPDGTPIGMGTAVNAQIMREMLNVFAFEPERAKSLFKKYF